MTYGWNGTNKNIKIKDNLWKKDTWSFSVDYNTYHNKAVLIAIASNTYLKISAKSGTPKKSGEKYKKNIERFQQQMSTRIK